MQIPDALTHSLRTARHVMVLTGAGISAESGLATFRTPQTGLWERFKPEQLATPSAYRRDPALVWGWYEWRRMQVMWTTCTSVPVAPRLCTCMAGSTSPIAKSAGNRRCRQLRRFLLCGYIERRSAGRVVI